MVKTKRSRKKKASSRSKVLPRPPRKTKGEVAVQAPKEEGQRIALLAAEAALDKKARAIEIIDVTGKVDYADYLVLMTGQSDRHVAAIADAVDVLLGENDIAAISIEGMPLAHWVLIDYVDVVVHVFQVEARAVYDLDGLWMDAKRVPVPEASPESS